MSVVRGSVAAGRRVVTGRHICDATSWPSQVTADTNSFSITYYYTSNRGADPKTGLYYYGLRYLDTVNGRWISKDPIEEGGGVNLLGFAGNNSIHYIDCIGLRLPTEEEYVIDVGGITREDRRRYGMPDEPRFQMPESEWRIIWLYEQYGYYREVYNKEAADLIKKHGAIPRDEYVKLRDALKTKFKSKEPPEVKAALDALFKQRGKAGPSGNFDPTRTNAGANFAGKVCKSTGRVFMALMVYSEYQKIRTSDDWSRQLSSSSGNILGQVGGGVVGGRIAFDIASGLLPQARITRFVVTVIGSLIGANEGGHLVTMGAEHMYNVAVDESTGDYEMTPVVEDSTLRPPAGDTGPSRLEMYFMIL